MSTPYRDKLSEANRQIERQQQEDLKKSGAVAVIGGVHYHQNGGFTNVNTLYFLKGSKFPGSERIYGSDVTENVKGYAKKWFKGGTLSRHPDYLLGEPVFYVRLNKG